MRLRVASSGSVTQSAGFASVFIQSQRTLRRESYRSLLSGLISEDPRSAVPLVAPSHTHTPAGIDRPLAPRLNSRQDKRLSSR